MILEQSPIWGEVEEEKKRKGQGEEVAEAKSTSIILQYVTNVFFSNFQSEGSVDTQEYR